MILPSFTIIAVDPVVQFLLIQVSISVSMRCSRSIEKPAVFGAASERGKLLFCPELYEKEIARMNAKTIVRFFMSVKWKIKLTVCND